MSWGESGFVSILASWVLLVILVRTWKGNASMTLSQHAAQFRASRIYYAAMWLLVLPPFVWFMIGPFLDKLELGILFKITALVAGFLMLIAAIVPELPGWKYHVHRYAAFGMATLFMPLTLMIGVASNANNIARTVSIILFIGMLVTTIYLSFRGGKHPRMLIFQSLYVLAFHISILAAYYL